MKMSLPLSLRGDATRGTEGRICGHRYCKAPRGLYYRGVDNSLYSLSLARDRETRRKEEKQKKITTPLSRGIGPPVRR